MVIRHWVKHGKAIKKLVMWYVLKHSGGNSLTHVFLAEEGDYMAIFTKDSYLQHLCSPKINKNPFLSKRNVEEGLIWQEFNW